MWFHLLVASCQLAETELSSKFAMSAEHPKVQRLAIAVMLAAIGISPFLPDLSAGESPQLVMPIQVGRDLSQALAFTSESVSLIVEQVVDHPLLNSLYSKIPTA